MPVMVGPATITINHNNRVLIAQPDDTIAETDDVGFFARDTRLVSDYSVTINGSPLLINPSRIEHFSAATA